MKILKIDRVILRNMKMPLKEPFETSFGSINERSFLVVELHSEGEVGYAEVVTERIPLYNEECIGSAWHVAESFLIPLLFKHMGDIKSPEDVSKFFKPIKRNYLAKSGIESAYWDLYAKKHGRSLASTLSGTKHEIEVGVSIGIQDNIPTLLKK